MLNECIELQFSDEYRCGYDTTVIEQRKRTCRNCTYIDENNNCNRDGFMIVPKILNFVGCNAWEAKDEN